MIDGVVVRPGTAALRDLRRVVPLLLPGGLGGGADHHPYFRIRYSQRPAAGGKVRRGLPTHQHPARHPRRRRARPHLSARAKICGASASPRRICAPAIAPRAFSRLMRFEAARARAYYNESAPLLDLIHPRSRPSLLGPDHHLLAPAGAHRAIQLRRLHPPRTPLGLRKVLDSGARAGRVRRAANSLPSFMRHGAICRSKTPLVPVCKLKTKLLRLPWNGSQGA